MKLNLRKRGSPLELEKNTWVFISKSTCPYCKKVLGLIEAVFSENYSPSSTPVKLIILDQKEAEELQIHIVFVFPTLIINLERGFSILLEGDISREQLIKILNNPQIS